MWAAIAANLYNGDLKPKTQADIERAMADWIAANRLQRHSKHHPRAGAMLWQLVER